MIKARVLVVDDTGYNRLIVQKILTELDCEVLQAANGVEALKLLSRERFHVVITDLMMPEMDGVELHRRVRTSKYVDDQGEIPVPPFILLTAFSSAEMAESAVREGFKGLLLKPVDRERLLSAVSQVFDTTEESEVVLRLRGETARQLLTLSRRLGSSPEQAASALLDAISRVEWGEEVNTLEKLRGVLQSRLGG